MRRVGGGEEDSLLGKKSYWWSVAW